MPKLFSSNILKIRNNYKVFSFRFYSLWSDWASYTYLQCVQVYYTQCARASIDWQEQPQKPQTFSSSSSGIQTTTLWRSPRQNSSFLSQLPALVSKYIARRVTKTCCYGTHNHCAAAVTLLLLLLFAANPSNQCLVHCSNQFSCSIAAQCYSLSSSKRLRCLHSLGFKAFFGFCYYDFPSGPAEHF